MRVKGGEGLQSWGSWGWWGGGSGLVVVGLGNVGSGLGVGFLGAIR